MTPQTSTAADGAAPAPAIDLPGLVARITGSIERSGGRVVAVFVAGVDPTASACVRPRPLAAEGRTADPRTTPTK